MKSLLLTLMMLSSTHAFAEKCKVSGISDSPQKISCRTYDGFHHMMRIEIFCKNGQYVFEKSANRSVYAKGDVTATYHVEVQEGASPLGFSLDAAKDDTIEIVSTAKSWLGRLFGKYQGVNFRNSDQSGDSATEYGCAVAE